MCIFPTYHALSDKLALPTYVQAGPVVSRLAAATNSIFECISKPRRVLTASRRSLRGNVEDFHQRS